MECAKLKGSVKFISELPLADVGGYVEEMTQLRQAKATMGPSAEDGGNHIMSHDGNDEIVIMSELAQRLGMDPSNARRWLIQNGFNFLRVRSVKAQNQITFALRKADAEAAVELRKQRGYAVDRQRSVAAVLQVHQDVGCFYVVQVIPELSPQRIKLGFATDINGQIASYRTVAPTARLIKTWPCRLAWEEAAIACATKERCKRIGDKVYDCDDFDLIVSNLEQFFALMPQIT